MVCLLLGLGCWGRSGDVELGGETNWFGWCEATADCVSGSCVCGICTMECSAEAASCAGGPPGSVCALTSDGGFSGSCQGEAPSGLCLVSCSGQQPCQAGLECLRGWCRASSASLGPTAGGPELGGNPCGGSWEVGSPEQLEALRGCTQVDDLTIDTWFVTSLEPLSELRVVTNQLTIAPGVLGFPYVDAPLWSLAGLQNLRSVAMLALSGFGDADLEMLGGLRDVRALYLTVSPNLLALSALANASVAESLVLDELPALREMTGPSLPSKLAGVSLSDLPSLDNLAALREATSVDSLILSRLAVTNLEDLAGLVSVSSAELSYNASLSNLDGLRALRNGGALGIHANDRLENIDALSNVQTLSSLSVQSNGSLTHLPEFAQITSIDDVSIISNERLRTGPSFPLLANGNVEVSYNGQLEALGGFSNLAFAGGLVNVLGNASLQQVDLGSLRRAERVQIASNPNLVRIDLGALESVNDLGVYDNESLGAGGVTLQPALAAQFGVPGEAP